MHAVQQYRHRRFVPSFILSAIPMLIVSVGESVSDSLWRLVSLRDAHRYYTTKCFVRSSDDQSITDYYSGSCPQHPHRLRTSSYFQLSFWVATPHTSSAIRPIPRLSRAFLRGRTACVVELKLKQTSTHGHGYKIALAAIEGSTCDSWCRGGTHTHTHTHTHTWNTSYTRFSCQPCFHPTFRDAPAGRVATNGTVVDDDISGDICALFDPDVDPGIIIESPVGVAVPTGGDTNDEPWAGNAAVANDMYRGAFPDFDDGTYELKCILFRVC